MTRLRQASDVEAFVSDLLVRLPKPAKGTRVARPAHAHRYKAKTICRACGARRIHASTLAELAERLKHASIHTDHLLTAPGLCADDWVQFARVPFPTKRLIFEREAFLQDLLRRAVGTYGPLKDLRLVDEEYTLSTGRRIDMLCEEARRDHSGRLVAVERKRDRDERTFEQVVSYLRELRVERIAAGHRGEPRGLVISGRSDESGAHLARTNKEFQIEWFIYTLLLEPLR